MKAKPLLRDYFIKSEAKINSLSLELVYLSCFIMFLPLITRIFADFFDNSRQLAKFAAKVF